MPCLRRLVTAEARVRSWVSPCEICGGQSDTGTCFSATTSVFPCQYNSTIAPYSLHIHFAVIRRTNGRSLGAFRKAVIFGNRGTLDRKEISLFSLHSWLLTLLLKSRPSPRHASAPSGTHPPPAGPFPLPNPVHVPFWVWCPRAIFLWCGHVP